MKAVELFCGIGCSTLGLVQAGFEVVGAVDTEKAFVNGFNGSGVLPAVAQVGDVSTWEPLEDFDLVSAGPTCKAFSPGASLFGTRGRDDERNAFPATLSFIERHRPQYALIENTFGLKRFGGYLDELVIELAALGYWVTWYEVDAYDFGVPQHRPRVVFLCSQSEPWEWTPQDPVYRNVGDAIREGEPPEEDPWSLLMPWSDKALAYWRRDPRHAKKHRPLQYHRPASVVVANYKRGIPYGVVETPAGQLRRCGPRLAARLQGLPDSFRLAHIPMTRAYEGIGNGFPPPVVRALVSNLLE